MQVSLLGVWQIHVDYKILDELNCLPPHQSFNIIYIVVAD